MRDVSWVQKSTKIVEEVQNECNGMDTHILQKNYNFWAEILVYISLMPVWVCILAVS